MPSKALIERPKDHFLEDLSRLPANGSPKWLIERRKEGRARFEETPYPHTKMEEWRQTNIGPIVNTPWRSTTAPSGQPLKQEEIAHLFYGEDWTELVFVDGRYEQSLSRSGESAFAGSLEAALESGESSAAQQHLGVYLRPGRNAFTALNTAFVQDGAWLHVPRGKDAGKIHFIFVTSQREEQTAAHLRNLLVLEENASASVATTYWSPAQDLNYLNNVVEEIALGPNAHLKYVKVVLEGNAGHHLATTEVHQERDSGFTGFTATLSGKIVRNQHGDALEGENASCFVDGLYVNDQKRLADNMVDIVHAAPHCSSRIMYKGVLEGSSHAVFTGKVYVHREAQQTDSNQLSNNLLLSNDATVDAKPQLEIYADDVKCTHGATIGAPPEQIIFYFRSRGIDEKTASAMLTYGFAEEVVEEAAIEAPRERLKQYIFDRFQPRN